MAVRVVTDSTAYLPADVVERAMLRVVPLTVNMSGRDGREGIDVAPADVARALGERRVSVTTSRPAPAEFVAAYRDLLRDGASGVVSIHLSARLSGTYESAVLAAAEVGEQVAVVDTATAGVAVGFAALAAAEQAADGGDLASVQAAAAAAAARTSTLFYVDTLEFMRRGGRIGVASALVGTALAVKPILHVAGGAVVLKEKVRTAGRALARLVDLAAEAAGESAVDIAVQHLGAADRAEALRDALVQRLAGQVRDAYLIEVGAVLAAHTGPGVIGVAVHRRR
ncbi:MAG TPA: DegV family protein [Micromonosporaceae bacterium]